MVKIVNLNQWVKVRNSEELNKSAWEQFFPYTEELFNEDGEVLSKRLNEAQLEFLINQTENDLKTEKSAGIRCTNYAVFIENDLFFFNGNIDRNIYVEELYASVDLYALVRLDTNEDSTIFWLPKEEALRERFGTNVIEITEPERAEPSLAF